MLKLNITCLLVFFLSRYRFDMSVEEAAELARRAIYHATFRDGASGGVVSGKSKFLYPSSICFACKIFCFLEYLSVPLL